MYIQDSTGYNPYVSSLIHMYIMLSDVKYTVWQTRLCLKCLSRDLNRFPTGIWYTSWLFHSRRPSFHLIVLHKEPQNGRMGRHQRKKRYSPLKNNSKKRITRKLKNWISFNVIPTRDKVLTFFAISTSFIYAYVYIYINFLWKLTITRL